MDRALTVARSFSTKERRKLSIGLSAAKEAEAAKNKEVLGKPAIRTAHTPTHEAVEEKAAGEEEARGTTPTDTDGTPHQFLFIYFLIKLLSTPNFDGGGHTFSQEGKTSCC